MLGCSLKVVFTTFFLDCFSSVRESTCKTGKIVLFHFKSSYCSPENQILVF